jgi:hypothetical protein
VLDDLLAERVEESIHAIRISALQEASRVVVRSFSRTGETLSYAKIGLTSSGRSSVLAEAAALRRIAGFNLRGVRHPKLLRQGFSHGLPFVTMSALAPSGRSTRDAHTPFEAMAELAAAGSFRITTLQDSAWASRLRARLGTIEDESSRRRMEAVAHRLLRCAGALSVRMGCWHGDWTAWNMAYDSDGVLLWDWEHFTDDMPVGADALHFRAQQLRLGGGPLSSAEHVWTAEIDSLVRRNAATVPGSECIVAIAYLLEVNIRFLLDRQGTVQDGTGRNGWGISLLERLTFDLERQADGHRG